MSEEAGMDRLRKEAAELVDRLKQERDELRLQSHLLKAELRDEWEELEDKWDQLEHRVERMADDVREPVAEIGASLKKAGEEMGEAYRRLRKHLK